MLDRDQLETFATVAEQQSFRARGGAVLHVTRGAVSQRVKALEESLATIPCLPARQARHADARRRSAACAT